MVPESDEQVARDAHELPEDEHLEEVRRGDEPEHAETEQRKQGEESAHRAVLSHVAQTVDVHHEADERDDHEHHHRERVHEHPDFCDEVACEREEVELEERRLLRGVCRGEVVDGDRDGRCRGNAVAGDGECGRGLRVSVAEEKPVYDKCQKRE